MTVINGIITPMERPHGTPTFFPQLLQVARVTGPKNIFLMNVIPGSLQCGQ